ncbi:MAG: hypothetical protein DRG24_06745 [Epsilonproteobacteria bacterium]|nr:MAG: hypothetical protein DRG24_06745 [Campylobacterota bacterium]
MQTSIPNILVVDDTKTNIDILLELLSDEYEIVVASDGESALEIVDEMSIDLILLDIVMPVMDGFEVCKILKNSPKTSQIPVLFITAKTDETSLEKAYEVGGADYVTKPFKARELKVRIKNQLELKSLIYNLEERVKEEVNKVTQAQELLLQNSRMAQMGEMISMIAHQWRQPLNAISAITINLVTKLSLGKYDFNNEEDVLACQEKFTQSSQKIDIYIQNLSSTIDDFRNFFKPDKEMRTLPVRSAISKALHIIEASLASDNIKVIQNSADDKSIEMYDSELMQVFLNLFKNAQDTLKEERIKEPKITIITQNTQEGLTVEVIDNGGGVAEKDMAHIFDPYFSTKSEKTGTGLGLYMSKTIINTHHKGNISVRNTKDGACFTITLKNRI